MNHRKKAFAGIIAALVLSAVCSAAQAGPAWGANDEVGFSNGSWSFGDVFTVGNANILATALGAYDIGQDGFEARSGVLAGLFRESDGALLATATVQSSDMLIGGYRFASISNVLLMANTSYRVVAVSGENLYNIANPLPDTISSLLSWDHTTFCSSTSLVKCDDGQANDRSYMANLLVEEEDPARVPEPGTPALLAGALLALGWTRWRRAATVNTNKR